jgi:hypothetical protein
MPELRKREGWAWTRVFRRHEDYEAALAQMQADDDAAERERELV